MCGAAHVSVPLRPREETSQLTCEEGIITISNEVRVISESL